MVSPSGILLIVLLRSLTDQFLIGTKLKVQNARFNLLTQQIVANVENHIIESENSYKEMDYLTALEYAKKAREEAALLSYIPSISNNIILIGVLLLGVSIFGFTLGYWVHNRIIHRKSADFY